MEAVLCCLKQTCWDSLEFSTLSEISQWWSSEERTHSPGNNLTNSDKQIQAEVCITSLKEASRLTQMAYTCQCWTGWRQAENPLCCLLGKQFLQTHGKLQDISQQWQLDFWTQLEAEVCWWFPLLFSFRIHAILGPPSYQLYHGSVWGHWKKKKKRYPEWGMFLQHIMMWTAPRRRVENRKMTIHKESRYCSLYKCYWITCSLFSCVCQKTSETALFRKLIKIRLLTRQKRALLVQLLQKFTVIRLRHTAKKGWLFFWRKWRSQLL